MKDLIGERFGRWLVQSYCNNSSWLCVCDCGASKVVPGGSLKSGRSSSCGCLRKEITSARKQAHGHAKKGGTPTYKIWRAIRDRCLRETNPYYKDYGGRGITICERWNNYADFLADMGERPEGLSIDRRDNAKGYSKENCYWATSTQQNNNRRDNVFVDYNGERRTIRQWEATLGFKLNTLNARLHNGWGIQAALSTPPGQRKNAN